MINLLLTKEQVEKTKEACSKNNLFVIEDIFDIEIVEKWVKDWLALYSELDRMNKALEDMIAEVEDVTESMNRWEVVELLRRHFGIDKE